MSSTSSVESAALASGLSEQECELSPSAKSMSTTDGTSAGAGLESPSLKTCARSERIKSGALTLFAEGFLARTSAALAKVWASRAAALASGKSLPVLLASYDPASRSWRTSQLSIFEGWDVFSQTLPRSGMTRNGTLFQLGPLAPLTNENAAGLLPTPRVSRGFTNPTLGKPRPDCLPTRLLGRPVLGTRPRPAFVEWMMGFPIGWLTQKDSATASAPKSRRYLDERYSQAKQ
jgi:hypothetical protein